MSIPKLYPPTIGNTIPAFYKQSSDGKVLITVPFITNRSVSQSQVETMKLKLKTITNDFRIITKDCEETPEDLWDNQIATFKLEESEFEGILNIGQYYKIQLAYVYDITSEGDRNSNVGYYSTVGISKYSCEPTVTIEGLDSSSSNAHQYSYIGYYAQTMDVDGVTYPADTAEKVYYYKFVLENSIEGILDDTGWLVHNNSDNTTNTEYTSIDKYEYLSELPDTGITQITYYVQTNNKIEKASDSYTITNATTTGPSTRFNCVLNFDNGYVDIVNIDDLSEGYEDSTYVMRRLKNSSKRDKVGILKLGEDDKYHFRDFTFEQNETYVQEFWGQINDQYAVYENSYEITADFEDAFLYDGERQLKIRYNSNVSAIHETIYEAKTDTLGSKFAYFSRNGNVRYRDFQLSGTITFQMDEEQLFSIYGVAAQPTRDRTQTPAAEENPYLEKLRATGYSYTPTDLVKENFWQERKFREEVLAWLNNGQYKLFRSPTEGILLVRLMNVNMTPLSSGISRMVYNFSCQVYEAAEHDYQTLIKQGIIKIE